jgi:hypothetical protein
MTETDPEAPRADKPVAAATSPKPLDSEALSSVTGGFGAGSGWGIVPGFGGAVWVPIGTWPHSFPVAYKMPDR